MFAEPVPLDDIYCNVRPRNFVRVLAGHATQASEPAGAPEERIPFSLRAVQSSNSGTSLVEADVRSKIRLGDSFYDYQDQFVGNAIKAAALHAA